MSDKVRISSRTATVDVDVRCVCDPRPRSTCTPFQHPFVARTHPPTKQYLAERAQEGVGKNGVWVLPAFCFFPRTCLRSNAGKSHPDAGKSHPASPLAENMDSSFHSFWLDFSAFFG